MEKERIVIHSDLNNFYATVERVLNPALSDKPLAVCGNKEERRGIVLAKSEEAKKFGVKTGDTVWQAQKKCPEIVIIPPHFDKYMQFSRKVKAIYAEYTDLVESYGIDECWLDVTRSTRIFPPFEHMYIELDGKEHFSEEYLRFLGDTIRERVKRELGVTVSCGVSFNKVFAKLGSDLKKPDGTTVISAYGYKDMVYGLPVGDLLYVGNATCRKLCAMGLDTIGKLAAADDKKIREVFGKNGETLLKYARGEDDEPVKNIDYKREYKSIGNSCTYPEDVENYARAERLLYVLSESVASRLRETGQGLAVRYVQGVRQAALQSARARRQRFGLRQRQLAGDFRRELRQLQKARSRRKSRRRDTQKARLRQASARPHCRGARADGGRY